MTFRNRKRIRVLQGLTLLQQFAIGVVVFFLGLIILAE
jgi:hypothetical protein